jgi:hypothetical protein
MTSRHGGQAMNPAQQALYMTFSASYRDPGETGALFLRQMCWIPQELPPLPPAGGRASAVSA